MDPMSFVAAFVLSKEPDRPRGEPLTKNVFVAEPKPAEEPKPVPVEPPEPVTHEEQPKETSTPPPPPPPPQTQKAVLKEKLTPKITLNPPWRLADASGQVWESPDLVNLKRYVAARNAALTKPSTPYYYAGSVCAGGQCHR